MKDELRRVFKEKRKGFCGESRSLATQQICSAVLKNFGDKNSFFIYNSFGAELNTSSIISALLQNNKQIYMPKIIDGKMYAAPYCGNFKKGAFGVNEPISQPYLNDIDVAIIPLLAVNRNGFRLGYGGGFYDAFLKNSKAIRAGVGFSFQYTDINFEDVWDEPLNFFISENGVMRFGAEENK